MKTSSKKLEKCQVKLAVTLDADEVSAIVKDVEKVFLREAQLPGFRKGKVPLQVIRKEFADGLKQEVQRAMFQKTYADAIKAEKVDEVALARLRQHNAAIGGLFPANPFARDLNARTIIRWESPDRCECQHKSMQHHYSPSILSTVVLMRPTATSTAQRPADSPTDSSRPLPDVPDPIQSSSPCGVRPHAPHRPGARPSGTAFVRPHQFRVREAESLQKIITHPLLSCFVPTSRQDPWQVATVSGNERRAARCAVRL